MMTNAEVLKDFYNRLKLCEKNLNPTAFSMLKDALVNMQRGVVSGHKLLSLIVSMNDSFSFMGFHVFFHEIPTEGKGSSLAGIVEDDFEFPFTDVQYCRTIVLVLSSYFNRPLNDK